MNHATPQEAHTEVDALPPHVASICRQKVTVLTSREDLNALQTSIAITIGACDARSAALLECKRKEVDACLHRAFNARFA